MKINIYTPPMALQPFVMNTYTIDFTLPEGLTEVVNPYPPSPFQSLLFYCNNPVAAGRIDSGLFEQQPLSMLTGAQFSRMNIKVQRKLFAIRVDFLPGGMYQLLKRPMLELFDGGFDAIDFFGAEMRVLNDQLQEVKDLEKGKNLVEQFLLKKLDRVSTRLPFDAAMQVLLRKDGNLSIEKTAALSCLSLKQFERKCKERIGMNPKTYARIIKFSKAYRLHELHPEMSWIKIAHQAEYFDQMHMIRDFKLFAGVNPSVMEQELLATPLRMQKDMRY